MLRWILISGVSAAALLSVELLALNSVYGRDKDGSKGADRASSATGGNTGGSGRSSSRSFDSRSVQPRNIEPRSVQPRNVEPRSTQPRSFDTKKFDTKNFDTKNLSPRVQTQPRTRIDAYRPPTGGSDSRFSKPKDTPRLDSSRVNSDAPRTRNDAAAEAIRNAQQKLGTRRTDSSKRNDAPNFDPPKLDKPKFEKPSFTQPGGSGRRDALDRIKRPDTDNLGGKNDNRSDKFDRLPKDARDALDRIKRPNTDNLGGKNDNRSDKFDRLPKDARDALDRANLRNDLKLGDGKRPGDRGDGKVYVDREKLGLDKLPNNADRRRDLENRLGIDKSDRDRYDLLHHRIKYDGKLDKDAAARLARQSWVEKTDRKHYEQLAKAPKFDKYRLDRQYHLYDRGDVARRLDLHDDFVRHGGWQHRNVGFVSAGYRNNCAYRNYWGPSWYPRRCWYPVWNNWVNWSWGFRCDPWYDPRPIFCRPLIYNPCPIWTVWQYPVWQPLPLVAAGTWVDVPPVVVDQGIDVQLLAVRFVDPGHWQQNLGQRFRVWLRNNSPRDIVQPFNVVVMGSNDAVPDDRRLEIGQRVPSLEAGQTIALDLRLPLTPNNQPGDPFDYSNLHVLVDAHRELNDVNLANNGTVLDRGDILPVDPAAFNADSDIVEPGMVINIAGEGLGPEPGQLLLSVGNETYQPEILGWYDLGVQMRVPEVAAEGLANGDLVIIRGDGAAANPLTLQIAGAKVAGRAF